MAFLYLKLTEQQEQPEEVKTLPTRGGGAGDWIIYRCESLEQAQALEQQLKARGYEADAGQPIKLDFGGPTIYVRLDRSEDMPDFLKPFYPGGPVEKPSIYQFRFEDTKSAQAMVDRLVAVGVNARMSYEY